MPTITYRERRSELKTYFDRTAAEAWARLTSDAPVSRIRATVRAGRERMRGTLLDWLPADLRGRRVLDAGCGTGALAAEAARRGADVVAVDISATLVAVARDRLPRDLGAGHVEFLVGDMLDPALGRFDHVVAMDSLIHYRAEDIVDVVARFVARVDGSMVLTFAPRTAALATMHAVGRLIPHREHRAPAIEPVSEAALCRRLAAEPRMQGWHCGRTARIASGFYTSQALEIAHE